MAEAEPSMAGDGERCRPRALTRATATPGCLSGSSPFPWLGLHWPCVCADPQCTVGLPWADPAGPGQGQSCSPRQEGASQK